MIFDYIISDYMSLYSVLVFYIWFCSILFDYILFDYIVLYSYRIYSTVIHIRRLVLVYDNLSCRLVLVCNRQRLIVVIVIATGVIMCVYY